MSNPRRSHPRSGLLAAVLAVAAAVVLAGCAGGGAPIVAFDPAAPCPAEGQQPGAYPDLERLLPTEHDGAAPDSVDSGRSCTAANLGSLAAAGITELRFAGATWSTGGTSGLTVAAFTAEGLDPELMREFYALTAEEARRTERLQRSDAEVGGVAAKRLDVLGSDGTGQTVVAWQEAEDGVVWVLLAADLGDAKVAEVLETLGSR